MDVVIVIVLVVLSLAVACLALVTRRAIGAPRAGVDATNSAHPVSTSTALVAVDDDAPAHDLERRERDGAVELWWPGGGRLATVRADPSALAGSALRSPWVRRSVGSVLRKAIPKPSAKTRYRITFPPDLMETMATGGSIDVALAGGSITGLGAGTAAVGPVVALAAGAAAVSVAQQQRLDRTLAVIEQRLDHIVDRMRDGEHGQLDAAEALLDQVEGRVSLSPSTQLRNELAVARHSADAVYFARRRFVERLCDAIGDAQEAADEDDGARQAWASGVLEAVGDPDQLRSELLVYLRALVVRARLATSTAGVLAADGDAESATLLLDTTVTELRNDFYTVYRRLRPLARWAPRRNVPWKRREWERAHQAVTEVFELMAGEVEPSLPGPDPVVLELEVVTDDDGDVIEVSLPD